MREVFVLILLVNWNFWSVTAQGSVQKPKYPLKVKTGRIFEATIDLNSKSKQQKANAKLTTLVNVPSENVKASDYGDYEDYELTKVSEDGTTSPSSIIEVSENEESLILEPLSSNNHWHQKTPEFFGKSISAREALDELSRLMGDPHHLDEQLSQRTTVTREDMTVSTTTPLPQTPIRTNKNEVAFFKDEEIEGSGSSEDVETSVQLLQLPKTSTSRKPLTTIVQEVNSIPPTASPDPFENLDYDLATTDRKQFKKKTKNYYKKRKGGAKLHGGDVGPSQPKKLLQVIPSSIKNRKKNSNLRKINKIDKTNRIRKLNSRINAYKRMRIRKVIAKPNPKSYKFFVGSTSLVTTTSPTIPSTTSASRPFLPIDHESVSRNTRTNTKTRSILRQKRDISSETQIEKDGRIDNGIVVVPVESDEIVETVPIVSDFQLFGSNDKADDVIAAGGDWDTSPIEISVLTSMKEQQPYFYTKGPTQVEPSKVVKEQSNDEFFFFEYQPKTKNSRGPLSPVTLEKTSSNSAIMNPRRKHLKSVGIKSVKKFVKKAERIDYGDVDVEPRARKPRFKWSNLPLEGKPTFKNEQWN